MPKLRQPDDLMGTVAAAKSLNVHISTFHAWRRKGVLVPAATVDGKHKWTRAEIERVRGLVDYENRGRDVAARSRETALHRPGRSPSNSEGHTVLSIDFIRQDKKAGPITRSFAGCDGLGLLYNKVVAHRDGVPETLAKVFTEQGRVFYLVGDEEYSELIVNRE
jgi:hypothetical protein